MTGLKMRILAVKSGFRFWQIAQTMGIGDNTLTRLFRKKEVPVLYEKLFMDALESLRKEMGEDL